MAALCEAATAWIAVQADRSLVSQAEAEAILTVAETAEVSPLQLEYFRSHLLALAVFLILMRQMASGERLDLDGLRIAGRFLDLHPGIMKHAAKHRPRDPEQAEAYNTLFARAQAAARGGFCH